MKIAVFSDTHRCKNAVQKCVDIVKGCDLFLHLGDNLDDFYKIKELSGIQGHGVIGNTDISHLSCNGIEEIKIIEIQGKRLLLTHGHLFDVKNGIEAFTYYCEQHKIDIAFYGHSHIASLIKVNEILYLNPGSIALPRGGSRAGYGIVKIEGQNIIPQLISIS